MSKQMIWRSDDIQQSTDLKRFKEIHALFVKYKVLHTISIICKGIEENKPLVKYIKAEVKKGNIDPQIHAWVHYDFTTNTENLSEELEWCVYTINKLFGKKPDTLFPPWNRSSPEVEMIAKQHGLKVSNQKISLSNYLNGKEGDVINFHSWADEVIDLEPALKKYTS